VKATHLTAILAALTTLSFPALCGEDGKKGSGKVLPVLKPNAALVAKLKALPENTWLKLPPPTIVKKNGYPKDMNQAKWGPGAATRGYCNIMAWAPDRKRVFYCGAGHNTHPYEDVWEYDLGANTWICQLEPHPVFRGVKRANAAQHIEFAKKNVKYENGIFTAKNGGPLRAIHTWGGLCYDSDRKKLLWLDPCQGNFGMSGYIRAYVCKAFEVDPKAWYNSCKGKASFIFGFNPATQKYDEVIQKVYGGEGAIMLYIPDKKSIMVITGNNGGYQTYFTKTICGLYNPETKKWTRLATKGRAGYSYVGAYDPHTRSVVCVSNYKTKKQPPQFVTKIYSFDKNEWRTELSPCGGRDNNCTFFYDSTARRFVLRTNSKAKPDDPKLWLYDIKTGKWEGKGKDNSKGDVLTSYQTLGYHDEVHNASVFFPGKGPAYVYRLKKTSKQEGATNAQD
jgi:hypothetical protein